jgi:zinc and cadmium transporter
VDGVLIGASYLVGPQLGISTTIAVLLHEIPQELGDFGILIQSGLSIRRAVLFDVASASTAILGTILVLLVGSVAGTAVTSVLVPVTAEGFVYIAAADLIPELQHDRSVRALLMSKPDLVGSSGDGAFDFSLKGHPRLMPGRVLSRGVMPITAQTRDRH